jgi:hypothetical protein
MQKTWSKLGFFIVGLLSLVGIGNASASTPPPPAPKIAEVTKITPLYLQLGVDLMAQMEKQQGNTELVQHWSHYSHGAHRSHWAHYAHRSHYSHNNYYR